MSWLFIDAFLNSAKWNQLCTSIAEWAVLPANREVSFALSGSHNTKNAKIEYKIYFGNARAKQQRDKSGGARVIK